MVACGGWMVSDRGQHEQDDELDQPLITRAFIALYNCGTGPEEVSTTQIMIHMARAIGDSSNTTSSSGDSSYHYASNKGRRYVW